MARKKYSCDFETTTDIDDCRVWAYGWMEIGKKKNYAIGNSLEEFMQWVKKSEGNLYFHNLKFDGSFIVNWLLKNGFTYSDNGLPNTFNAIISNMGQWYMIDICYGYNGRKKLHTVIYDSLKKLPFSVDFIGKSFKLGTMKTDVGEEFYHRPRPIGHVITEEEYGYIKNDIEVIADALEIQFSQGLDKMTSGSDSLAGYKAIISEKNFEKNFPIMSLGMDAEIRKAYRGGFTWLNKKYAEKDIGTGIVFDVNSLYPAQMYMQELPFGMPIEFSGEYEFDEEYPLFIQHITCEFELKDDRIPTIQIKRNPLFKGNEYLHDSKGEVVDLYVTNVDLELMKEHYDLYGLEYHNGWKFRSKTGMFNNFIDKWTYVKITETGAKQMLAKLMLNSLYGKFASNPNVTGRIPYLRPDGSNGFELDDEEYKKPVYTPMGIFITSWARHVCITTAQKCFDRIIYCDTDSIHLVGEDIPDAIKDVIDPKKMGFWDHEATFESARYLRQKTYAQNVFEKRKGKDDEGNDRWTSAGSEDYERVRFKVTCAGMGDKVKAQVTWDNFKIGFKTMGSLKGKQVNGGVVLVDSPFSIT